MSKGPQKGSQLHHASLMHRQQTAMMADSKPQMSPVSNLSPALALESFACLVTLNTTNQGSTDQLTSGFDKPKLSEARETSLPHHHFLGSPQAFRWTFVKLPTTRLWLANDPTQLPFQGLHV